MRRAFKLIVQGTGAIALAGVVMALQTPPETAISNAGLWVKKISGLTPAWLQPQSADTWATILVSLALGAVLLSLYQSYRRWQTRMSPSTEAQFAEATTSEVDEAPAQPEPNISLTEVGARVERTMPPRPEGGKSLTNYLVSLNLKIADEVVGKRLSVWGRSGQAAIKPLSATTLDRAIFDARRDQIRVPGVGGIAAYDDVKLCRAQVDEIWPPDSSLGGIPAIINDRPKDEVLQALVKSRLPDGGYDYPKLRSEIDRITDPRRQFKEAFAERAAEIEDQAAHPIARQHEVKLAPPARVEEWMPLHQALHYLVYDSLWARGQHRPETKEAFDQVVSMEFRERLSRGEVRARGAKGVAFSDDGKPTEEIPVTYWVDGFVLPHGVIALGDVKQDAVGNSQAKHTYRRVIIHRGDLFSTWPPSGLSGLTPLSAFVEPLRKQIEQERSQRPGGSFEEFGYSYKKAVLQASIKDPRGTREAREVNKPYKTTITMILKNEHRKALTECSVVLVELECNGIRSPVGKRMRVAGEGEFTVQPNSPKHFALLVRDMSDAVTPAPFLLRLNNGELPLEESSTYILVLELRSRYPIPTRVTVRIDTGTNLDVEAEIVDQRLPED